MSTGADGNHPATNQFVWQPLAGAFYAPCVDGAYDFGVFGHEFGHLIENRMIGKGVGARQGNAAGAMGEAFGDFDALAAFNELHLPIPAGSDRYTEGAYATGNGYNGIRDFLAGRPMGGEFPEPGHNPDTDPLNYGDFGFDIVGPEVHADGELWVAVQIDLRDLFLSRNPSPGEATDVACVHGRILPQNCPGDRQWIQDYYDAMVIMPRGPDHDRRAQRDACRGPGALRRREPGSALARLRHAGLRQPSVHGQQRGHQSGARLLDAGDDRNERLGAAAEQRDRELLRRLGRRERRPRERENLRRGLRGAVDADRRHQFGDGERRHGRHRQPRQHGAVRADGAGGRLAPPHGEERQRWWTYNFVAVAPGYGHLRFWVKDLKPGEVRNITIHMPTNYASAAQGATITTDAPATGTNVTPGNLIDDAEGTSNTQSCTPTATCLVPVNGRWVVIKLGAAAPTISSGSASRRCSAAASWGCAPSTRTPARPPRMRPGKPDLRRLDRRGLDEDHHGADATRSRASTRGRERRTSRCGTSTPREHPRRRT